MPPSTTARAYCQRLQLVTLALIISQLLFLIIAFSIHAPSLLRNSMHEQLIIQIGFVVGIGFIAVSFLTCRRTAADLDQYRKMFFVAFALAELGTLTGLTIFFLLGNTTPLVVLAVVATVSIYAHYATITGRILASRELNPLG
jgi:hypothetical protein